MDLNANIEIKDIPEMKLAGLTQIGVRGMEQAFEKIIRWATSQGLLQNPDAKMVRVFHDSFKITVPDKVRMTIGLITPEAFEMNDEIHESILKPSRCIVGNFEITPDGFEKAWSGLFIWMNENRYKKADANPFEIYYNDFRTHPENKAIVQLLIPIE